MQVVTIRSKYCTAVKSHALFVGIKKAVQGNEKATAKVSEEISRDEATLKKLLLTCKEKQSQLVNMRSRNRELEVSTESIEEKANRQEDQCELQRQEHDKQVKVLLGVKTEVHTAKQDYNILSDEIRRVKEEIARTETKAFSDHNHLYHIDEERKCIEKEANSYIGQLHDLKIKKERLAIDIESICREIDEQDQKRDSLRQQCRHNIGDKDIIVSAQQVD